MCSFKIAVVFGGPLLGRAVQFQFLGIYEPRTKFRLGGGTFTGLYRVLGGPIKGYITNLVQAHMSYSLNS